MEVRAKKALGQHFIETSSTFSNSSGTWYISTVGIKGIWTGDFYEFIRPGEKYHSETEFRFFAE